MKEILKTLIIALVIAFSIRTVLFEPYTIPSGSMKPNFEEGDYIFVSKFSYGISKYSFPFWPNIFEGRKFVISKPQRGDVVVFRIPTNPNIYYIKRLIGIPGDKISVKSGQLYVNQEKAEYKNILPYKDRDGTVINQYIETLPNKVEFKILDTTPYGMLDNTKEFLIPEKHYFFMGDNRDGSIDSRFEGGPVGFVSEDLLIGKVKLILFSNPAPFWKLWEWLVSFDFDRFFKIVKP